MRFPERKFWKCLREPRNGASTPFHPQSLEGDSMTYQDLGERSIRVSGIYAITHSPTGKLYIGSSSWIAVRWRKHVWLLEHERHNSHHLQAAWKMYGPSEFDFTILESCDPGQLLPKEQAHLDSYPKERLYNLCPIAGKPNGGPAHRPYARMKAGQSRKGFPVAYATKLKISRANKNKPRTPEWLSRLRASARARRDREILAMEAMVGHE